MALSKRIQAIISFVNENMNCADIGADHGFVVESIAKKYSKNHFLAVENKIGPYKILLNNIQKACLNNVIISFSDGIEALNPIYNTVILTGMGGYNIIDIIKTNITKTIYIKNFIIEANNNFPVLYEFLNSLNYALVEHICLKDNGKFYLICQFEKKESKIYISRSEILASEYLLGSEEYKEYFYNNVCNETLHYNNATKLSEKDYEKLAIRTYIENLKK